MNFIYVCGLPGSGKGVLRVLLDSSSSNLITCPFQGFGYELLNKNFSNFISRKKSIDVIERQNKMTTGYILVSNFKLTIGEFTKIVSPSLLNLIDSSHAKFIRAASSQDKEQFVKFNFNYNSFLKKIYKAFLEQQKFKNNIELYTYLIKNFILEWKKIDLKNKNTTFVTSMHNGTEVLENLANTFQNKNTYKIISLINNYEGYLLSNYLRYSEKMNKTGNFFKFKFIFSIKNLNKYRTYVKKTQKISENNIKIVTFSELIKNTKNTMLELSKWLKIDYSEKMLVPTLDSRVLEDNFTKNVHDLPQEHFNSFTRFVLKLYSFFHAK